MKILANNYSFTASTGQVFLSGFAPLTLNQFLLITNVAKNTIVYNFADPLFGGSLANNILTLSASTAGMSNSDPLQIFLDDLSVPALNSSLTAVNLSIGTGNTYLNTLQTTVSASISAARVSVVPAEFDSVTVFGGHVPVGGRFVDSSSFSPLTTAMAVSALTGYDAAFNVDANTGGMMALQGDLDKDIDSVTNFPASYASVSNYLSGTTLGSLTGTGTQVLSANYNRITLFGQNFGVAPLLVKYGVGCNISSFSFILYPGVALFDGRGEKYNDDRYTGDVSVNTLVDNTSAFYMFWEGV